MDMGGLPQLVLAFVIAAVAVAFVLNLSAAAAGARWAIGTGRFWSVAFGAAAVGTLVTVFTAIPMSMSVGTGWASYPVGCITAYVAARMNRPAPGN